MKRLVQLLAVAAGLVGTVGVIGCLSERWFPLNRDPRDNPQTIKAVLDEHYRRNQTVPTGPSRLP